jgi:hypothetical protein
VNPVRKVAPSTRLVQPKGKLGFLFFQPCEEKGLEGFAKRNSTVQQSGPIQNTDERFLIVGKPFF